MKKIYPSIQTPNSNSILLRGFLGVLSVLGLAFFSACSSDDPAPANLPGKWTDDNQIVLFTPEKLYSIKYLRFGRGTDTVKTDSVWGNYTYNAGTSNVSFLLKGIKYRAKKTNGQDSIAIVDYNSSTWNIRFEGNNNLKYTSSSSIGFLRRL